jgi:WD40 repeat protein
MIGLLSVAPITISECGNCVTCEFLVLYIPAKTNSQRRCTKRTLRGHTQPVLCIKATTSTKLISSSEDKTLRIWDIRTGKCDVLEGHKDTIPRFDVHCDIIASASHDGTCRLWNLKTKRSLKVLRGHQGKLYSVSINAVKVATSGEDGSVRVWNSRTAYVSNRSFRT